jgi:hypothetical protein
MALKLTLIALAVGLAIWALDQSPTADSRGESGGGVLESQPVEGGDFANQGQGTDGEREPRGRRAAAGLWEPNLVWTEPRAPIALGEGRSLISILKSPSGELEWIEYGGALPSRPVMEQRAVLVLPDGAFALAACEGFGFEREVEFVRLATLRFSMVQAGAVEGEADVLVCRPEDLPSSPGLTSTRALLSDLLEAARLGQGGSSVDLEAAWEALGAYGSGAGLLLGGHLTSAEPLEIHVPPGLALQAVLDSAAARCEFEDAADGREVDGAPVADDPLASNLGRLSEVLTVAPGETVDGGVILNVGSGILAELDGLNWFGASRPGESRIVIFNEKRKGSVRQLNLERKFLNLGRELGAYELLPGDKKVAITHFLDGESCWVISQYVPSLEPGELRDLGTLSPEVGAVQLRFSVRDADGRAIGGAELERDYGLEYVPAYLSWTPSRERYFSAVLHGSADRGLHVSGLSAGPVSARGVDGHRLVDGTGRAWELRPDNEPGSYETRPSDALAGELLIGYTLRPVGQ